MLVSRILFERAIDYSPVTTHLVINAYRTGEVELSVNAGAAGVWSPHTAVTK